jgi:hypothetical protein
VHTPPLNPRAQVLWLKHELKLDCAPCFERSCRFGHTRCLVEVTPRRVQSALDLALRPADETAGFVQSPAPFRATSAPLPHDNEP